jgi:hypothetical protein
LGGWLLSQQQHHPLPIQRDKKMNYESPIRDLARKLREVARNHISYPQVAEFMNHVDSHLSAIAYAEEVNRKRAMSDDLS